jgi:hypothetical protein
LAARVLVGALLGFACAAAILATRLYLWGDRADQIGAPTWGDIFEAARSYGILLGALYFPLAAATLLEKENLALAALTGAVATTFAGTIAFMLGGHSVVAFGASVGFWFTCAGIYRRHKRNEKAVGFDSYFR